MKELVFDIETNGLMNRLDLKVLCIVALDPATDVMRTFDSEHIDDALHHLNQADRLIGHNIAGFDIPVLERLYPHALGTHHELYDTYAASRMTYVTNLYARSIQTQRSAGKDPAKREARMPSKLLKAHSLKAWGYRLGIHKGDLMEVEGVQEECSAKLIDYCRRDVWINKALYFHLRQNGYDRDKPANSERSVVVESEYARIIGYQERNGVGFNVEAARELAQLLEGRRTELQDELWRTFKPWFQAKSGQKGSHPEVEAVVAEEAAHAEADRRQPRKFSAYTVPKRGMTSKPTPDRPWPVTRYKDCPLANIEEVSFNARSQKHIADRLTLLYGWKPRADGYTPGGDPIIDEKVLSSLSYPPVPALIEFLMVNKRLGQLSEGKQAWLKKGEDGIIFGRLHTTGTRTFRCAHFGPNLGQVPKVGKPYGVECRSLFGPRREGWVQVGADAAGLELRMLAHRMAYFDDGAFGKVLLEGDPHSDWMKLTGLYFRENQKTLTYATLYGAGDYRMGCTIVADWQRAYKEGLTKKKAPTLRHAKALGTAARASLLAGEPALELLVARCKAAFRRGYVTGLDGRIIVCKTEYGALNDVLQSDGAIVMKHAKVICDRALALQGIRRGRVFNWMLDVHDEWQIECKPDHAEAIGMVMVESMVLAGRMLGIRVPLDGEYKVGNTWAETH